MLSQESEIKNTYRWQDLSFILFHLLILAVLYLIYRSQGMMDLFPLNEKLQQWDTGWYNDIRKLGYQYSEKEQSSSGFFPLFPYLWRWSGLSVIGISIFNGVLSLIGLFLLQKMFKVEKLSLLLFLSLPSIFFLFVPYTESLFFFFSSLFLLGLKKDHRVLIWIGLFFASLTRSTGVFFVPAMVYMVAFTSTKEELFSWNTIRKISFYILPICCGVAVVILWQWIETGVWFAYFKAQSAHWYRSITVPSFPLSTWNYTKILWVDALAFLVGLFAILKVINRKLRWLQEDQPNKRPNYQLFSEAYLAMVFISFLLINPKNASSGVTEISGANRYLFVSPFFFLFLVDHLKQGTSSLVHLIIIPITWLLFNVYDTRYILPFLGITLYAAGFLILPSIKRYPRVLWLLLYLAGLSLQLYLFDLFIKGEWVG